MKTSQYKARILFLGPCNAGKTRLANYLADISIELPDELRPTKGLRIVEYDLNGVAIDGANSNVDVQIWDTSGDEKYMAYWSVFRKNVDGVVFVYDQEDDIGVRKLDHMYNYFVSQPNLSLRTCLVCSVQAEEVNAKLSPAFSKISQITVNIDSQGEKFKQDFTKYVQSVVIVYAYIIVYLAIPAEITFDTTNKVVMVRLYDYTRDWEVFFNRRCQQKGGNFNRNNQNKLSFVTTLESSNGLPEETFCTYNCDNCNIQMSFARLIALMDTNDDVNFAVQFIYYVLLQLYISTCGSLARLIRTKTPKHLVTVVMLYLELPLRSQLYPFYQWKIRLCDSTGYHPMVFQ